VVVCYVMEEDVTLEDPFEFVDLFAATLASLSHQLEGDRDPDSDDCSDSLPRVSFGCSAVVGMVERSGRVTWPGQLFADSVIGLSDHMTWASVAKGEVRCAQLVFATLSLCSWIETPYACLKLVFRERYLEPYHDFECVVGDTDERPDCISHCYLHSGAANICEQAGYLMQLFYARWDVVAVSPPYDGAKGRIVFVSKSAI